MDGWMDGWTDGRMDGWMNELMMHLQVQAPGDEMGYMYDMGDHWMHDICLVSVFPPEESTGRCEVWLSSTILKSKG